MFTAIFWGGTFIAGRSIAGDVGPFSAAFLRFAAASALLLFLTWKSENGFPSLKRKQILPVFLLGMTGVFSYNFFFFKGLQLIDAGRASLIIANNPVFITLLSACIFKEKLGALRILGIVVSVSGAMIVISKGNPLHILRGTVGWGEILIFGAVVSWVVFSLIGKSVMKGLSPLVSISYSSTAGTVCLLAPAIAEGMAGDLAGYSAMDWMCILYLGVFGTVLGFVWYYEGINRLGPSKASIFINFVPISAIILAFLILKEPVTLSLFVGAALVISGAWLANRPAAAQKA